MNRKPISDYSNEKLLEMCLASETFPKELKEGLTKETIQQQRVKVSSKLSVITFFAILKSALTTGVDTREGIEIPYLVIATKDILTQKYRKSNGENSLIKKKRFYGFNPETGDYFEMEHWGNKSGKGKTEYVIKPFDYGVVKYQERTWQTYKGEDRVTLEIISFTPEKEYTPNEIYEFLGAQNRIETLETLDTSMLYKLVAIKASINGVWRIKKIRWATHNQKYEVLEEMYEFLEYSLDPSKDELVPVLRFDLNLGVGVEQARASAEFRATKFGQNICLLPEFDDLLKSDMDARAAGDKGYIASTIPELYADKDILFIGVLNKYDPAFMTGDGLVKTIVNIDLGIVFTTEKEIENIATQTTQATIEETTETKQTLDDLIATKYDKFIQVTPDKDTVRTIIIDAIKRDFGEKIATSAETLKKIDAKMG